MNSHRERTTTTPFLDIRKSDQRISLDYPGPLIAATVPETTTPPLSRNLFSTAREIHTGRPLTQASLLYYLVYLLTWAHDPRNPKKCKYV